MNIYALMALVNVVTSVVLGFLVLRRDYRSRTHQTFAAFALAISVWSASYFFWQISSTAEEALFWVRMLMAGAVFITPVYLHFILRFLKLTGPIHIVLIPGYLFIFAFSILNWTSLFVTEIGPKAGFAFWPTAGPAFTVFLLIWMLYAILPVYFLFRALRKASPLEASPIRYILAGTIIGYAGGISNYFMWYDIFIPPVGNISASIYLAFVAYAIMRFRLFDMRVIATELLVFSLWLLLFVRMLASESQRDQLLDAGLLAIGLFIGAMLLRSVSKEISQRERIEAQEQALEHINHQQENLLHFISHEIKGYLTQGQNAFAAIVEGDFGAPPPKVREIAQTALVQMRKGVGTIMDILDASNLKKGTVAFKKETFDFRAEVEGAIQELRPMASEKALALELSIDSNSGYSMTGDREKLHRHVIRNLIDNAIRYTPSGSIHATLARSNGSIVFSVKDTGVGITDEDKKHLFTEGGHGKDSIKINVHSTGYGLFIAKQIIEAHNGTIRAVSAGAGKGTEFIVIVPVA